MRRLSLLLISYLFLFYLVKSCIRGRVFDRAQFLTETRASIVVVQLRMDLKKYLATSGDPDENRWRPHVGSRPTGWEPLL